MLQLDPIHLESRRVVSYRRRDPSHVVFDVLRTKAGHAMREHGWVSLAVTSPTPGCGKTFVALNLAFSLARQTDQTVALVDLDLRNPQIALSIGQSAPASFNEYLRGETELAALFAQVGDNLLLGLNNSPVRNSAEWMRSDKITKLQDRIKDLFSADIIIFDLPPTLSSDDVMVFSPHVDCAILVAAAGKSTAREIEDAERQLSLTNFLGVVLNRCPDSGRMSYGYGQ